MPEGREGKRRDALSRTDVGDEKGAQTEISICAPFGYEE
jgi:hypothetical protein